MTCYLCMSVTFLDPLFHGQGDHDPEWPPSPMRLFQALLAGGRAGSRGVGWSDDRAAAFQWLERQAPPLIIASDAQPSFRCTYFVPNNNSDKNLDRQDRLTSKVAQPQRLIHGDTVHFLWPLASEDETDVVQAVDILRREARTLLALGWGIDQAAGCCRVLGEQDIAALSGHRWQAWKAHRRGSRTWRVPVNGSLHDLEESHETFRRRIDGTRFYPPRRPHRYNTVHYLRSTTLPPRSYAVFELPEGVGFRPESTAIVAAMLRSLTCRSAKTDTHEFPGGAEVYVAGHVDANKRTPPRFSYLPLPTIGHTHADGAIRRLLVAEPFDGAGTHASWVQRRLRNAVLQDEHGGERGMLIDLWRPGSRRVVGRYVDESQVWSSVTPVVLPGLDDGKQAKAERLFLKAAVQAEIPLDAIESVTLRKAPFWPGAAHPRRYFVPEYLRGFARWHVMVRFHEPVPGPLAIGAGRHVGLGLFAGSKE